MNSLLALYTLIQLRKTERLDIAYLAMISSTVPSPFKDGKTIYTTDVIVEEHEFAQNKDSGAGADSLETLKADKDGFMEAKDEEIPFD